MIPRILTLIPRLPIIPVTPYPDPSFQHLQITEKIDSLHRGNHLYSLALLHYLHPGLTLFRMDFFGAVFSVQMGGQKSPLPNICHTYPTMMKLDTVIP